MHGAAALYTVCICSRNIRKSFTLSKYDGSNNVPHNVYSNKNNNNNNNNRVRAVVFRVLHNVHKWMNVYIEYVRFIIIKHSKYM
jgi:hypothetical protein